CDAAEAHEVLAVPELVDAAPPWASVTPVGEREIRGLLHPVALVELSSRARADAVVVDPVCQMELPPDAVVARRTDPLEGVIGFCSESCAQTWEGRRERASDQGLIA